MRQRGEEDQTKKPMELLPLELETKRADCRVDGTRSLACGGSCDNGKWRAAVMIQIVVCFPGHVLCGNVH